MIDIHRLRADPAAVRAAIARRGDGVDNVDRVLALDAEQRALTTERDDLRARINALSKEVGSLRRDGNVAEAEAVQEESRALGATEKAVGEQVDALAAEVIDLLLYLPNLPAGDCPDGDGEQDNVVVRVEGFDESAYGEH